MSNLKQSKEELDAALLWRGKHAVAIKERDALQVRLTAAEEALDKADDEFSLMSLEAGQRIDVLEGWLLKTNELLYAIQGDPGTVPSSAIDAMRGEVFKALKRSKPPTCTWSEGGFSWHTGCGKEWQLTDGGLPAENGMRFCHSCGKTLVVDDGAETMNRSDSASAERTEAAQLLSS